MTAALRPLGVMIIALLAERDMHPYEMMRIMRMRHDDRLVKLQNGTFYHQVSALVRDGYIAEVGVDREGNRPERTTYTLLSDGADAVRAWVRERLARADRSPDFPIALSEAHFLSREEATALLEARIAGLQVAHDSQRGAIDGVYARHIDPQFVIHVERDIALIAADIAWTQAFCRLLADPSYAWGEPSQEHRTYKIHREDIDA